MRMSTSIAHANITDGRKFTLPSHADYKSRLVDLGMQALAAAEWRMVAALTCIIQARELGYE